MPENTARSGNGTTIPARSSSAEHAAHVAKVRRAKARLMTIAGLDQRTVMAKRVAALIERLEADLGGEANLTEGQRQLVQRAACLGALIESFEAQWLGGLPVELDDYLAAVNNQRRVLATIGLERRARDITRPSLHDRLRAAAAANGYPAAPAGEPGRLPDGIEQ